MADIDTALAGSKDAVEQLIRTGELCGPVWTTPRAPGKWSPSQIVEHVARSLEESANLATGRPTKFVKLPGILQPLVRRVGFNRVLRTGVFPKGKTSRAMNPASGPATAAEGRTRLETAHAEFEAACRHLASQSGRIRTTIFGVVPVTDYVRFMELHTRHHGRQMPAPR
jgi:hypothetical protein